MNRLFDEQAFGRDQRVAAVSVFSAASGLRAYRRSAMSTSVTLTPTPHLVRPALRRAVAWRRWLPVAGPGRLMMALGLLGCTRSVLSWDEIATADVAPRSVPQIWRLAHHLDAVFSPYY